MRTQVTAAIEVLEKIQKITGSGGRFNCLLCDQGSPNHMNQNPENFWNQLAKAVGPQVFLAIKNGITRRAMQNPGDACTAYHVDDILGDVVRYVAEQASS